MAKRPAFHWCPVAGLFEGSEILLRGDPFVDPDGDEPFFDGPVEIYSFGEPSDPLGLYLRFGPAQTERSAEFGLTMLVKGPQSRGAVIHMPDGDHEVRVLPAKW